MTSPAPMKDDRKEVPVTKDELSLLLYLETCAVDNSGRVDNRKINDEDSAIMATWNGSGFVESGRIIFADIAGYGSMWARLSDAAWQVVHSERRARAARCWDKRNYMTTEEKANDAA